MRSACDSGRQTAVTDGARSQSEIRIPSTLPHIFPAQHLDDLVVRGRIERALTTLKDEGLIAPVIGKGYYVAGT